MMMGMTMPSQYNSITSTAPGIPASAQISTVIQFMGTGSPRNFAKARTMSPNIEFTTKYRIVLPRSITATKQQELKEGFDFFQLAGEQPTK